MTTILIKKKDTAGAPAPGDLTNAAGGTEIAVNTATKRIYTKDSGGVVVELGTNPSAITTNLLFSPDNTYDIGASGATRPRTGYFGTSLIVPLIDATNVEATNIKALDGTAAMSIANSTGVVSLTANPILSGGSANGVLYLNGSKVATSGSALVFDGTNLSTTGNITLANTKILCSDATSSYIGIAGGTSLSASQGAAIYMYGNTNAGTGGMYLQTGNVSGADMVFAPRDVEGMRLTSTGLGIGTTSPAVKLQVQGSSSTSLTTLYLVNSSAASVTTKQNNLSFRLTDTAGTGKNAFQLTAYSDSAGGNIENGGLIFSGRKADADTVFARIDTSGNFGLGVTPNAYGSTTTLTIGGTTYAEVDFESGSTLIGYAACSASALELTTAGAYPLLFKTNSTERARINTAGELLIGATSQGFSALGYMLGIQSGGSQTYLSIAKSGQTLASGGMTVGMDSTGGAIYVRENQPLDFYTNNLQRARITSGGNLLLGTTSDFNSITIGSVSNANGISWNRYMNVFSEYSSGAAYISSNYYPTQGASGYKTSLTASFGAAGIAVSGTGGTSNGGLIVFYVNPATSKTADAAFTPTEVAQITSDGSFVVGDTSARSGYTARIAGYRTAASGTVSNVASVTRTGGYAAPYTSASDPGFDWQFGKGSQTGTTTNFEWGTNGGGGAVLMSLTSAGNLTVYGSLSKGSGSFVIDHPLPQLEETHHLVHSFIEGPQADLIYRGRVNLVNGRAEVNIDLASGMTDGTFVALCRDVQCYTSNESDWVHVRGSVSGNILTIEAQDPTATSSISWMVIGERQDKHMLDTEWTDNTGKIIVEPTKASRLYDPTKDPMNPECPDYDPTLKPLL